MYKLRQLVRHSPAATEPANVRNIPSQSWHCCMCLALPSQKVLYKENFKIDALIKRRSPRDFLSEHHEHKICHKLYNTIQRFFRVLTLARICVDYTRDRTWDHENGRWKLCFPPYKENFKMEMEIVVSTWDGRAGSKAGPVSPTAAGQFLNHVNVGSRNIPSQSWHCCMCLALPSQEVLYKENFKIDALIKRRSPRDFPSEHHEHKICHKLYNTIQRFFRVLTLARICVDYTRDHEKGRRWKLCFPLSLRTLVTTTLKDPLPEQILDAKCFGRNFTRDFDGCRN